EAPESPVEETPDWNQRIQALEKDLSDTQDELRRVQEDYEKQSELVASLEAQLLAQPEELPEADSVEIVDPAALVRLQAEAAQWRGLAEQRNREVRRLTGDHAQWRQTALAKLRATLQEQGERLSREQDRLHAVEAQLSEQKSDLEERQMRVLELEETLQEREARIEELSRESRELGQQCTALGKERDDLHQQRE